MMADIFIMLSVFAFVLMLAAFFSKKDVGNRIILSLSSCIMFFINGFASLNVQYIIPTDADNLLSYSFVPLTYLYMMFGVIMLLYCITGSLEMFRRAPYERGR